MNDDHARSSPLSGLWSFLIGGIGLVALVVALDPVTRPEDCPNQTGNASVFSNPAWDLYLPMMALGWVVLIIIEQALPPTRRNRSRLAIAARAGTVVILALVGSCCVLPLIMIGCS